ncbi:MAG: efflux RND transporter periplasmic adaptor subunit [Leptospirales bacterium]|nr:efflux RND transporter periplasmic adaptor subunit [Leptospirales bacterium]
MQKYRMKIIIAVSVVIVIIITILAKNCGKSSNRELVYEKTTKGDVRKTISVTGELDLFEPINILSQISGVVEDIYTDFNQHIKKGQLLIKIDSSAISQRMMKAQSIVDSARLEIVSAEKDLEAKKNLHEDNLISKRAMEIAEVQYSSVLNKYKQAKIDYDAIAKEMNNTKIYSPINGIVVSIYVKNNTPVSATTQLILLVSDLKKMQLTINIDESDIGYIKDGQQVTFSVSAFFDKKFTGTINQIRMSPIKSGGLVSYQALVLCDNRELLLMPGMTATTTVIIEEKKNILRVRNQAFALSQADAKSSDSSKKIVWKKTGSIKGKPFSAVEVKTGLQGDSYTEITEGLNENDEIAVRIK